MVFQIVDDILDITTTSERLGKPAGHDMVEGVYTLPVLRTLAMDHGVGAELAELLGKPLDVAERDKALAVVRANEGVESAATTARRYIADAEEACADLPPGPATDALRDAPAAAAAGGVDPRLTRNRWVSRGPFRPVDTHRSQRVAGRQATANSWTMPRVKCGGPSSASGGGVASGPTPISMITSGVEPWGRKQMAK